MKIGDIVKMNLGCSPFGLIIDIWDVHPRLSERLEACSSREQAQSTLKALGVPYSRVMWTDGFASTERCSDLVVISEAG
jgi:hypothetical protein